MDSISLGDSVSTVACAGDVVSKRIESWPFRLPTVVLGLEYQFLIFANVG